MRVEKYLGNMTGRVFDPRSVTVVSGSVGDPINPVSTAANLTFTEFDRARVEELRLWWKEFNAAMFDEVRVCHLLSDPEDLGSIPVPAICFYWLLMVLLWL